MRSSSDDQSWRKIFLKCIYIYTYILKNKTKQKTGIYLDFEALHVVLEI